MKSIYRKTAALSIPAVALAALLFVCPGCSDGPEATSVNKEKKEQIEVTEEAPIKPKAVGFAE